MRTILLLIIIPVLLNGQCYNRYSTEVFSTVQITNDILYGESINSEGDTISLMLDYYEPSGDNVEKRPLLILMPGPDLVKGSKNDSTLVVLSNKLVRRGYTVAAINFRKAYSLQSLLDKNGLFKATLDASQDAKAAVRFFRKELQSTNNYPADSNMIWLGGIGGGSMAAQMSVYLNDTLEVSEAWRSIIRNSGGLEGNSGHPQYSSSVRGVINLSGAIIDTSWMSDNTEPIINIHGDSDDYYPYMTDSLFAYTHNRTCNGHHELCYKRLNEATFVQTHNSHANDNDFSILAANQNGDIPAQFSAGVRGLGLKLYYTSSFFCSGSGTQLYAYHGDPFLGCIKFSDIGSQILSFLNSNPDEFLFITIEGTASNNDIATGFNSAGLSSFLYQHTLGSPWPTIGELIDSGQRIIVMNSNSGPSLPGYHTMWDFIQDTEYNFQNTGAFNCNYLRGNTNSDIFLLNHFLTVASPQPLSAGATNAWDLVLNRARQCSAARGLHTNLLYIDFFNSGDVFRAADSLNRIGEEFPAVQGSFILNASAQQSGILSELYTISGGGFAPYKGNWGDTAAYFIADYMIRHFPCEMSCATAVDQISGLDTIWLDSVSNYSVGFNNGASYEWILPDTNYNNLTSLMISGDTSGQFTIKVIETSQYGCIYDTIQKTVMVVLNTGTEKIKGDGAFSIFPNPTSDKLWIKLMNRTEELYTITIYDRQGMLVFQKKKLISELTELDIDNLTEGIYVIKLVGKHTYSSKFTKKP